MKVNCDIIIEKSKNLFIAALKQTNKKLKNISVRIEIPEKFFREKQIITN